MDRPSSSRRPTVAPPRGVPPEVLPRREGYPLVVASLPGRNVEVLRTQAGLASEAGADLVEFRLDRLPASELPHLERVHELPLMHEWVPAIATLRSKAEGGEGPDGPGERRRLLRTALEALPFSVIDLELDRDLPLREELASLTGRPVAFVASAHLPESTPTAQVARTLERVLEEGDVGKVVLPATAERVVRDLLPLLPPFRGRPFVLHTTGGAGSVLRVLAPRTRMAWVFGSLPLRAAPGTPGLTSSPRDGARGKNERGPAGPEGETGSVEPSQIPVDRLRRFIASGPETPWFALVGRPLGHSLSPEIHEDFFRRAGVHGIYVPVEIGSEEELRGVLLALRPMGLSGINVTRPWKTAAYRFASRRSESALESGSVNALVPDASPSGGFAGHNTDVEALTRWWEELGADHVPRLLVVGTGGAARAAVLAGVHLGAQVWVVGRDKEAARGLARDFPDRSVRALEGAPDGPFPLVVNATPVGQEADGAPLEVPLDRALGKGSILVDLVYRPRAPTMSDLARSAKARYTDGMRMLLYQAAGSFRLFTGQKVPSGTVDAWIAKEEVVA